MLSVVYQTQGDGRIKRQILDERSQFDVWTHDTEREIIVIKGTYKGKCKEIIAHEILSIHVIPEVTNNV